MESAPRNTFAPAVGDDDRSGRWVAIGWILALTLAAETLTLLTFLLALGVLGWVVNGLFLSFSWGRALGWACVAVAVRVPVILVAKPALTIYMQRRLTRSLVSMETLDAAITFAVMFWVLREHMVSRSATIEVAAVVTVAMTVVSVIITKPWRQTGDNALGG